MLSQADIQADKSLREAQWPFLLGFRAPAQINDHYINKI